MAQPPPQQQQQQVPPPALNLNNPMHNLANQIAALIQQMQAAPPPQVNLAGNPRELSAIPYPEFQGGDQDPITWLEDVEKAFEAN
ncbi:hypothetical protein F8M41_000270 [Gigaspora margarita]|uniref:Uncharacterized protein n=1 Tax=Gigaspora margarita TaxID=4874 RepID=A0A8H4ET08_GIGMA|nr:hypothetical protein F8M41_000270 [Gigaspora margarita]